MINLGKVPINAKLFTADAVSMYTNIDPIEGIATVNKYIRYFANELEHPIDRITIIKLLTLVMNNCVFKFGDTTWLPKIGTAMGTPCACIYVILFFAYFERTFIQRKYKNNLLFYIRQIDDIFGV